MSPAYTVDSNSDSKTADSLQPFQKISEEATNVPWRYSRLAVVGSMRGQYRKSLVGRSHLGV